MAEMAVSGTSDDLTSDGAEFFWTVTECDDFSRAHKCEIKGVEEKHQIFALKNKFNNQ